MGNWQLLTQSKTTEVPSPPDTNHALTHTRDTCIRHRQDGGQGKPLASLPVFVRHDCGAGSRALSLSTRSVQKMFVDLASRAGILERFHLTPYTLRHFFATEFLSETGDLALTQYALGHASPPPTRIYAQTKREDYRQAERQAHRYIFGAKRRWRQED